LIALMKRSGPIFSWGAFAGKNKDGTLALRVVEAMCWDRVESPCNEDLLLIGKAVPTMYQEPPTAPTDTVQLRAFGMPETYIEFDKPRAQFTAAESKEWDSIPERKDIQDPDIRRAAKFVDLTIAYHPQRQYVGGDVDAVKLNRSGSVDWIQRKPNCPAD